MRLTAQRILAEHLRDDRAEDKRSADPPSPRFWPDIRLDLAGATLIDFNFYRVVVADARFAGATFTGTAQFYGAIFGGASFHGANFAEDAAFSRADFTGRADFSQAAIAGKTWFSDASFGRDVDFNGASFGADAMFYGTNFEGTAEFQPATFTGDAMFARATFRGPAWFSGTTFARRAFIRPSDLYRRCHLPGGRFRRRYRLQRRDIRRRRGQAAIQADTRAVTRCSSCLAGRLGRRAGGKSRTPGCPREARRAFLIRQSGVAWFWSPARPPSPRQSSGIPSRHLCSWQRRCALAPSRPKA